MFFRKEYRSGFGCFDMSVGYFSKNFRAVTDISYKYCVFRFEYHFGFGYFNTSIGCFGKSFRLVSFISYEYCVFR